MYEDNSPENPQDFNNLTLVHVLFIIYVLVQTGIIQVTTEIYKVYEVKQFLKGTQFMYIF